MFNIVIPASVGGREVHNGDIPVSVGGRKVCTTLIILSHPCAQRWSLLHTPGPWPPGRHKVV